MPDQDPQSTKFPSGVELAAENSRQSTGSRSRGRRVSMIAPRRGCLRSPYCTAFIGPYLASAYPVQLLQVRGSRHPQIKRSLRITLHRSFAADDEPRDSLIFCVTSRRAGTIPAILRPRARATKNGCPLLPTRESGGSPASRFASCLAHLASRVLAGGKRPQDRSRLDRRSATHDNECLQIRS